MPTTPATRKPTRATTRTATTHKPGTTMTHKPAPPAPRTSVDYLEEALKDLGKAREKGGKEIRASIDAAMEWVRQAAKELGSRSQGQVGGWQKALDAATDGSCASLA